MPSVSVVRSLLDRRYSRFRHLPNGERLLLTASVLVNDFRVREQGPNSGPWVAEILRAVHLGPGSPWCAAFIEFCAQVAGVPLGPRTDEAAAVRRWHAWAADSGRIRSKPQRGRLCLWLRPNGTGHIGVVAAITEAGRVVSYEGNTSSGDAGSQRDGDGAYRRVRHASRWTHYIELDEPAG